MKKLLLGLVLGASVVMASDMPTDDLLAVATQGKTAGSQFEMSKSEMQKVDGGYGLTWYNTYAGIGSSYYNTNTYSSYSSNAHTRIYARAWGNYYWGRSYGTSW